MQWKKTGIRIIEIILLLFICSYIGQNFVNPAKENNKKEVNSEEKTGEEIGLLEDKDWVYQEQETIEDNPWGYAIGIIDMEDESKALFMTPETEAVFSGIKENEIFSISFHTRIHPWVQSKDGAVLIIEIEDKNTKEILQKEEYQISSEEKKIEISLKEYTKEIQIKIYCNAGEHGNRDGDWVILSEIKGRKNGN